MASPAPQSASPLTGVAVLAPFVAVIALIYYLHWREVAAVRRGLEAAGARDARVRATFFGQVVEGIVDGLTLRHEIEQGGKNSPSHTSVVFPAPAGTLPFEMHLSVQTTRAARLVAEGREVDVEVGDATFDDAVLVEAAPAEIARAVLDSGLRKQILAQMPCTLSVSEGSIRLRRVGKKTSAFDVQQTIDLVRAVAARLMAASSDLARAEARDTSGYRGQSATETALRSAAGERELAHLRQIRDAQARRARRIQIGFFALPILLITGNALYVRFASSPARSSATTSKSAASATTAPPASTVVHAAVPALHPRIASAMVTPAVFCDTVAGIRGASRRAWCNASEQKRPATAAIIKDSDAAAASCRKSIESSVAADKVAFDAEAAFECIQATYALFDALPPASSGIDPLEAARVAACKPVLTGSVAKDAACVADFECKAGLSCGGKPGSMKCKGPAAQGQACGREIDVSATDIRPYAFQPYFGETHLHDACLPGLECSLFVAECKPSPKLGEPCSIVDKCVDGLTCRMGTCTDTPGRDEGEPCTIKNYDNDCRTGIACNPSTHICGGRAILVGLCQ